MKNKNAHHQAIHRINGIDFILPNFINGVANDSRKVQSGDLFIAIEANDHKRNTYINDAIKSGALAVLVSDKADLSGIESPCPVPILKSSNPRLATALIAKFFASDEGKSQPERIVAVTGTNGKSSVVHFYQQMMESEHIKTGNIGTLGFKASNIADKLYCPSFSQSLTTPDPIELIKFTKELAKQSYSCLALEASSHGLDQYRLDGLDICAGAFTNLTRDHLDYHGNMDNYRKAKFRLFSEILLPGSTLVTNADCEEASELKKIATNRHLAFMDYSLNPSLNSTASLKLLSRKAIKGGIIIELEVLGNKFDSYLGIMGRFQIENILCALALALATGFPAVHAKNMLRSLSQIEGRMEYIGTSKKGGDIIVDFAHTPDALLTVLQDIKEHYQGKVHLLFGCGGNRDQGKRSIMGKIAQDHADFVIITDDNPRFEDAKSIRDNINQSCPKAKQIAPRDEAIKIAIQSLHQGDVLIIAGKGHESGQIIGESVIEFNDRNQILSFLNVKE